MNTRQRIALAWPPLLLRIGLAITFIWAGAGKIWSTREVTPEQAAALANMGVPVARVAPAATPPATPDGAAPTPAGPEKPLPAATPDPGAPATPADGGGGSQGGRRGGATRTAHRPPGDPAGGPRIPAAATPQTTPAASGAEGFTPADFSPGTRVRTVYSIALVVAGAGERRGPSGREMQLWPTRLATGQWPVRLAWAVALTELIAGALVLVGALTRLSALTLAGVMLGAAWLTQIGPAVQAGGATLGFLPPHAPFDVAAWTPLLWQMGLLMMSLALLCAGPGAAAADNALLGGSGGGVKKPPAAPKPAG